MSDDAIHNPQNPAATNEQSETDRKVETRTWKKIQSRGHANNTRREK